MWIRKNQRINVKKLNVQFINAKPFPHIVLTDFFTEKIEQVRTALLNEHFEEQNSDLYQFQQTDDCKNAVRPGLKEFHAFFGSTEFMVLISKITGTKLKSIDMSGFIYDDTDYLLPHDDRLEGRKIAYIVQLSKNFTKKDGGALQLFKENKVVKSVTPRFNSLIMFKVSPKSVHQVQEVLSDKKRMTLAGWFHG